MVTILVAKFLEKLSLQEANHFSGQYYGENFESLNRLQQTTINRLLPGKVEGDKPKQSKMEFLAIIKRRKTDNSIIETKWLGNNERLSQPLQLYTQDICALQPDIKGALVTDLSLTPVDHALSAKKNHSLLDVNCTSPIDPPDNGLWQPKNIKSSSIKNTPNGRVRIAKLKKYVKSTNDN